MEPFPPPRPFAGAGGLARSGLAIGPAASEDLPFLRTLYASTRADELAAAAWPPALAAPFLDSQFALQHHHVVIHHPRGDFLIVSHEARRIGRLYIDRSTLMWRLVDIALLPGARRRGSGTALLRWLQRSARAAHAEGIDLHVLHTNAGAARLYGRLGFVETRSDVPTHRRLAWLQPRRLEPS